MKRYWVTFSIGGVVAIAACSYFFYLASSLELVRSRHSKKFDPKEWIELKDPDSRMAMTADIEGRYLRLGMTRKQTRALLGKPDQHGHFKNTKNEDSYNLGYEFLDPCTLDLTFSKDNKLISFTVDCS